MTAANANSNGPLSGLRVIEVASLGPGPFAAMTLADLGADVIRVDRAEAVDDKGRREVMNRGRHSVAVDLKSPDGPSVVLALARGADVLIEGFRPGVAERLMIGPDECRSVNDSLIYGRMTGWGQDGPYAQRAGHDINYVALTGVLDAVGRAGGSPTPPLNLVGDFGGGGMLLALGIMCALWEKHRSGRGQVVDAAMVDGVSLLAATFYEAANAGRLGPRGTNLLDSGAPNYNVYECADGRFISVGAIEPQFYAVLREVAGLVGAQWDQRTNRSNWPERKLELAEVFATRTSSDWLTAFEGRDGCVAPVLSFAEAPSHHHNVARGTFVTRGGVIQPGPAPRFSRTNATLDVEPPLPGEHTVETLRRVGLSADEVSRLLANGTVRQREETQ